MPSGENFMDIAKTISQASKDPSTKVGSVIVDSNQRIVSTGYNGFVSGNDENYMTFDKPMKYGLIIHAEMNALLFARQNVTNNTLFTTHSPCSECLKHILQCGIRKIYYDKLYVLSEEQKESIRLLILSTGASVVNINNNIDYMHDN